MNIIFMGTPEFARYPLEYLCGRPRHKILAVVTGPDRPSGRGLKLISTAVKSASQRLGLQTLTPESLKDAAFLEEIRSFKADVFVVVAFRILPESLFSIPEYGSINLHGSLLPKYRGAAPINWAIINGEKETGLTAFFLKKKVDTGDIIYQKKIPIGPEETFDELYLKTAREAGPVLETALDLIESGKVDPIPQDSSKASPAPKLTPEAAQIDWGFPARNVVNFIRGLSSRPGAHTTFRGRRLIILKARPAEAETADKPRPGRVIEDKHRLLVAVADGAVEILSLKPEGKGSMSGEQFLRGYRPDSNDILGKRENEGQKSK
jgi:methionyl-tRNA formyltransferase